jgi:hypothetical protein
MGQGRPRHLSGNIIRKRKKWSKPSGDKCEQLFITAQRFHRRGCGFAKTAREWKLPSSIKGFDAIKFGLMALKPNSRLLKPCQVCFPEIFTILRGKKG